MTSLASVGTPALALGTFCVLMLAVAQSLCCVPALARRRGPVAPVAVAAACDVALAAALCLLALLLAAVTSGALWMSLPFNGMLAPLSRALWVCLPASALSLAAFAADKSPDRAADALVLAALLPPFSCAGEEPVAWPFLAALGVLCVTVPRRLAAARASRIARDAVARAVRAMPEGVAYANAEGRMLLVNDAMRGFLAQLGVSADLSSAFDVAGRIERAAEAGPLSPPGPLRVRTPNGRQWEVSVGEVALGPSRCVRIVACDVTEEERLERAARDLGRRLEAAGERLERTLENAREAAREEASVRMRQRVHDVIGQRLSMLHRMLEGGEVDDEGLATVRRLTEGIVDELSEEGGVDWGEQLRLVVEAFALVDVSVRVAGPLPQDRAVAEACVQVVREAATNAVRHGHATEVAVALSGDPRAWLLWIRDNGTGAQAAGAAVQAAGTGARGAAPAAYSEGTGVAGMRRAVERAGGTLFVQRRPRFVVRAVFPRTAKESGEA